MGPHRPPFVPTMILVLLSSFGSANEWQSLAPDEGTLASSPRGRPRAAVAQLLPGVMVTPAPGSFEGFLSRNPDVLLRSPRGPTPYNVKGSSRRRRRRCARDIGEVAAVDEPVRHASCDDLVDDRLERLPGEPLVPAGGERVVWVLVPRGRGREPAVDTVPTSPRRAVSPTVCCRGTRGSILTRSWSIEGPSRYTAVKLHLSLTKEVHVFMDQPQQMVLEQGCLSSCNRTWVRPFSSPSNPASGPH